MIDLSGLLPKLLNATESKPELAETVAKLAWTRAAGDGLRNHAVPFRLYRRTLIVSVADAIWQKQLRQMSPEFIYRINKLLGRSVVDDIEFRIDPAAVDWVRSRIPAPRQSRNERRAPIPELVSAAHSIADPELRDRFIRAAENCIERRESRMQAR
jgi:predicted nucleic acid-binding Zn ribbon protein